MQFINLRLDFCDIISDIVGLSTHVVVLHVAIEVFK